MMALQMAATWGMVGVIWFVQLVHYPAYRWVGEAEFARYQREHMRRTTWVVFPLMMVELGTALLWVWRSWETGEDWLGSATGLGLVGVVWLSTTFWQVPLHRRLDEARDAEVIEKLVRSNWLRTLVWTMRGIVLVVWQGFSG